MKKIFLLLFVIFCSSYFVYSQSNSNIEIANGDVDISASEDVNIATGVNGKANYNGREIATKTNVSTVEQNTGIKWIDGKTIYQKTYTVNLPARGNMYLFTDGEGWGGFLTVVPELSIVYAMQGYYCQILLGSEFDEGIVVFYVGAGGADMTKLYNNTDYPAIGYLTILYTR